ncbi:MAG: alpha-galactosidase, partial [Clostridiales bacterium]|nr:alpha-galactosidase [Candidatus Blautia equi]
EFSAVEDGILTGTRAEKKEIYVTMIGTYDGTGPAASPVGEQSSELHFIVDAPADGEYEICLTYATGEEEGVGSWLQLAVGDVIFYDDFVPVTEGTESFVVSEPMKVRLKRGENVIRVMNHRRQENTLGSYATLVKEINEQAPEKDMMLSLCEWGKTQPANWGYKVGDSWRILNDITFQVGADGDPGVGCWTSDYTPGVAVQYNKAVIMDEFAGLQKGWNDPDMLMIGMNGLTEAMNRTHMAMWCMMNSPLMLGLDLRRVEKGDWLYQIIANEELIALNQDALGVQAKRIYCSLAENAPDLTYVRDNDRVDILAKPLADGSVALSFINVSEEKKCGCYSVNVKQILNAIGGKMVNADAFAAAASFAVKDLWSGSCSVNADGTFSVTELEACDNITIRVTPHVQ